MKWRCLVGHDWKVVATHPAGRGFLGSGYYRVTDVISRCVRCSKVKSDEIDGAVTLEQLNG